ncbi:biosynthetic arginine decarboxylase [Candidatus Nitrosacidococcus sp. I8]|uniref:biosynthetic arginine decarboxylase n=1 Tax=Candidatus Nitrosacidococcus sp. I8 TaxID=2942908 RepID=UPI002226804B|nr:biosynthetic arginine decarboxylase [Candidatus Nitrosacidococcus sp. I8]CAH9019272.1 Biosynthetic arginine decarboxylase [Candidatus Nitrosacidococcus sp. I8]
MTVEMTWNIQNAKDLYNIPHWSEGYFSINEQGYITAHPHGPNSSLSIDLYQVSQEALKTGLSFPILVRFSEILHHRAKSLCTSFHHAMEAINYQGNFTAVYPIKVNQQRQVIQEILTADSEHIGLEAGSKPELLAVMSLSNPNGLIICNGYKDREYIRLALIGRKLGLQIYLIVEKPSELEHIIKESQDLDITPLLGVRVRLASLGKGKWQNTGGEKGKFGLTSSQILSMIHRLKQVNLLDCLTLLHFHMGSQLANISDIQQGIQEAGHYYVSLHALGVPLTTIDVGGGLGVDYEGTHTRSFCSINYTISEYAQKIVQGLWEICQAHHLSHPNIITEAGRTMTAHHAVLISNIVDVEPAPIKNSLIVPTDKLPIIQKLWSDYQNLTRRSAIETYHNASQAVADSLKMFNYGVINIEQRAQIEQLYFVLCDRIRSFLQPQIKAHREIIEELEGKLITKYFCNFSLFRSLPDSWAINQVFPIVPLQRLTEAPTERVWIEDLTCDSDGRVDLYVCGDGSETSLPLHSINVNEPYLLGFFLIGAYQEILGDIHNLFGTTDSVHVKSDPQGGFQLHSPLKGDQIETVLTQVHFAPAEIRANLFSKLKQLSLNPNQAQRYLQEFEAGLKGSTYLGD